jgi:hypothetical protein
MWLQLAYALVMMVVSYAIQVAMTPKPQQPTSGSLEVPTPAAGATVPVIFGTNIIKSSNVIWYGDASVEAIKSKGGKK